MNRTKAKFVRRGLSAFLALTMVLGMGIINVFAAGTDSNSTNKNVTQLSAPVEDGVYYANITLHNLLWEIPLCVEVKAILQNNPTTPTINN